MNREEINAVNQIRYRLNESEEKLGKALKREQQLQDKIDTAFLFLEQYFTDDEQEPDLVATAFEVLRGTFSNSLEPKEYVRILRKSISLMRFEFQKLREKESEG